MKRWQVILNTVVDIATYLNEDVDTFTTSKKEVEKSDNNEVNHMDLKLLSDIVKEQENIQKQTEEEKKIMQEFLNSLSPDD